MNQRNVCISFVFSESQHHEHSKCCIDHKMHQFVEMGKTQPARRWQCVGWQAYHKKNNQRPNQYGPKIPGFFSHLCLNQCFVCVCRQQVIQLCRISNFYFDDPSCIVWIFVDRVGSCLQRFVEFQDLAT